MEGLKNMRNLEESMSTGKSNFDELDSSFFLLGLLSAFDNRYQAKADNFFDEISWKQFFAICCINLCEEPPTLKELAELMGTSHQNAKQILLKLEKLEYLYFEIDEIDKRKQRIFLTQKANNLLKEGDADSKEIVGRMYEGVSEKDIETTIKTIIKLDKNVKGMKEYL